MSAGTPGRSEVGRQEGGAYANGDAPPVHAGGAAVTLSPEGAYGVTTTFVVSVSPAPDHVRVEESGAVRGGAVM